MENSLKGLILAAGTIITCVVISLGFYIAREAKNTASGGANEINRLNTEFSESDKTIYDGAIISGSEVISAIKKMKKQNVGVCVKTNQSNNYYCFIFDEDTGTLGEKSNSEYKMSTKSDSSEYINPYASFEGKIVRDSNDVITGLIFSQEA